MNASNELEKEVYDYALKYNKKKDFVSMVCGAEFGSLRKCDKSGLQIDESSFYPKLKTRLLSFGNIGAKYNQTSIGCCAEVNASNEIYKQYNIELKEICLSNAYRPKTMQIREKCEVCKDIFL